MTEHSQSVNLLVDIFFPSSFCMTGPVFTFLDDGGCWLNQICHRLKSCVLI